MVRPSKDIAPWSGIMKNSDCSTGPLAHPVACSLAPLTRSLALPCSLRSRPSVNDWMAIFFFVILSILDHSAFAFLLSILIFPDANNPKSLSNSFVAYVVVVALVVIVVEVVVIVVAFVVVVVIVMVDVALVGQIVFFVSI